MKTKLETLAKEFKVLTLLGPRQSGKTWLVRNCFEDLPYANLEHPGEREFAQSDPRGFLAQFAKGAIIDEIQRVPSLLSYIQVRVDSHDRMGEFILTGSHQFLLMEAVTQSLAGRTAILKLLPMSLEELKLENLLAPRDFGWHEHVFRGFYPAIQGVTRDIPAFWASYFETYVQRDVRSLLQVTDLLRFQNFLRLCATRVGQIINKESLARDAGLSGKTVESWLGVLEASFIVFRLPPYFENLGKRLIKSPKLYFYDVGLAAHLLGISQVSHVAAHPLAGALFENLVILEVVKYFANRALKPGLFFFRDSNDLEVDLLVEVPFLKLRAFEIKSAMSFSSGYYKGLNSLGKLMPHKIEKKLVILGGGPPEKRTEFAVYPWDLLDSSVLSPEPSFT